MKLKLAPNQTAEQTAKYVQALQLAADGNTSAKTGALLFKGERTVEKWYIQLRELNGYKTKTQLIAEALRNNIIK